MYPYVPGYMYTSNKKGDDLSTISFTLLLSTDYSSFFASISFLCASMMPPAM